MGTDARRAGGYLATNGTWFWRLKTIIHFYILKPIKRLFKFMGT